MEIKVQSIRFEATEKLQDYIQKKVQKLTRFCADIIKADVALKVVKPETAINKEASLRLTVPGSELFTEKTANTFEEAIDQCADTMVRQLQKYKEQLPKKDK
ncbi:MAG: ribosome-associated translation inhibitor RaiA [Prevotellaceae bacterium]|nr:ribosome-associated translation inhibitor RaiA [Prevotellaceae bacterium]MCD8303925.1 ribosome-associated translation inhibitor RaiA [Prevotellaceae bacterium]